MLICCIVVENRLMYNLGLRRTGFQVLIVFLLIIGVFFRFVNLDKKTYWHDEIYTSLRVSGYTRKEVADRLFNGRVVDVKDLLQYQRLAPEKNLKDTVKALMGSPEHPPLYYLMARFWMQGFGSSVAVVRSLSACISLLVFPCIYWLCWELFRSPKVGWIAIALIAISPFHFLYAQEAREYSLWTVTILLSSASLLRAMRLQTLASWGVYALTLTLALYTFLFSAFVAIGHAIYVGAIERFRLTKTVAAFLIAFAGAVLAFAPWIVAIAANFTKMQNQTNWIVVDQPLAVLLSYWELHLSCIFVDFHPDINYMIIPRISLLLLAGVGYSINFLYRQTSRQVWLFIVTLIVVPALALILPDLILGGRRSIMSRYFVPCFLGIQIAVAYLLSDAKFSQRKIWPVIIAMLIFCGTVSGAISSQANTWWNKVVGYRHPEIARIINQANRPLLVSDNNDINLGNLISLSYLLDVKVQLLLADTPNFTKIPDGFNDIFLFNPSPLLISKIETQSNLKIEQLQESYSLLWKVKKR